MAIPVGSALGFALGGQVKSWLGWRWAFFLVVPPGVVLGILSFFMRDPQRGQADAGAHMPGRSAGWKEYRKLLAIPSYVLNTLGMTAMTFAVGGLGSWIPKYLDVRQKELGQQTSLAGLDGATVLGGFLVLAGLIATLAGGMAGDRLRTRWPGSYFLVSGVAMLPAFPLILLVIWRPFPEAWVYLFAALFCLFFNTGPTNTILANVTHPSVRASGFAFNIFVIHALGDAVSPSIMGWVADRWSLDASFILVSVMVLASGIFWLWGTRYLARDTERAPRSLD
jgi:predicted MFS family arabinose efflux permease